MSYQKYLGEGVILAMNDYGESGRILKILTNEGVRSLVATGVRELKSKMRSEIDILTKVEFEFVEGKEVGRLVGIFPKEKLLNYRDNFVLENILYIRNGISNITNFILRTVVGELPNENLYENFLSGLKKVQESVEFSGGGGDAPAARKQYFESLEIVWLIQILISLGYWEENKNSEFSEENLKYVLENKKQITEEINNSISSSNM